MVAYRILFIGLTAAVVGMSQACDVLRLASTVEVPATIIFHGTVADITVPDTVTHGAPFQVVFHSSENGCTDKSPRNEVTLAGDSVLIRSFITTERTCGNDALLIMLHSIAVTANQPGVLRIYVAGRKQDGNTVSDTTVTRTIYVR
jgi:hypothetical protein